MNQQSHDYKVTIFKGMIVPKETFYNLPDVKRQLIEKTATSEFAEYGYDKASITRIVEKCKIAKGSFYQYFDDKKDLYFYLLKRIGEEKVKAISSIMEKRDQYDFFSLIRELFLEGHRYAASNPEIAMIGGWLFKNMDHPICNELVDMGLENAQGIYTSLLQEAIRKGEIRSDIDIDFISSAISSLSISSVEYFFRYEGKKKIRNKRYDNKIPYTVDILIDFLKRGIGI